jgi:hypothetical protein
VLGHTGHDVLTIFVHVISNVLVLVGRVDNGGAERTLGCAQLVDTANTHRVQLKESVHVRGRSACRMFGVSVPAVVAFATYCRGVEEKARQLRDDRAAEVKERPVPSRIIERGAAMVNAAIAAQGAGNWRLE